MDTGDIGQEPGFELEVSSFKPEGSLFKLEVSHFELEVSNFKPESSRFKLEVSHFELEISNFTKTSYLLFLLPSPEN